MVGNLNGALDKRRESLASTAVNSRSRTAHGGVAAKSPDSSKNIQGVVYCRPVVQQARAAQTRQRIIDAAVTLFTKNGYLETDVKAITRAADLTPGAFYYHFMSKEALVVEIIAEGYSRIWTVLLAHLDEAEPGLENVIDTTLAQVELFAADKLVWVAYQLNQAFGHLSHSGRRDLQRRFDLFVEKVARNIRSTEIRSDITPEDVAELIWTLLQGSAHVSNTVDPLHDSLHNPMPWAIKNWLLLLRAVVAPEELPRFEQLLADAAVQRRLLSARPDAAESS